MDHLRTWICVSLLLALLVGCTASPPEPPVAAIPTTAVILSTPARQPAASAGAPRRPFPQHTTYAPGTIKPSQHSQEDLDKTVRNAYRLWKLSYLKAGCGTGRFHVDPGPDVS